MRKIFKVSIIVIIILGILSIILFLNTTVLVKSKVTNSEIDYIKNNHLEVPIKINDIDSYGLFDTGAQLTVVDKEYADKYGVITSPLKTIKVNNEQYYPLGIIQHIKIGDFEFKNVCVIVIDWKKNNSSLGCKNSDIIIGMNIIRQLIWNFDFTSKKLLIVRNSKNKRINSNANDTAICSIKYHNTKTPETYINFCNNSFKLLIDLGFDGEISISNQPVCDSVNPQYSYASDLTEDVFGKRKLEGKLLIKNIDIADHEFKSTVIHTNRKNELLGSGFFFKYFTGIIINPFQKEVIGKLKTKKETEFHKKISGLGFSYDKKDNALLIKTIYSNSPAANYGLNLNDTILSIDDFTASELLELNYCDFIAIRQKLLDKNEINISLLKKGKIQNVHLINAEY